MIVSAPVSPGSSTLEVMHYREFQYIDGLIITASPSSLWTLGVINVPGLLRLSPAYDNILLWPRPRLAQAAIHITLTRTNRLPQN